MGATEVPDPQKERRGLFDPKDDRALASMLRRAIVAGAATVVTTDDGRWWLQVDRTSISHDERELIARLHRRSG